MDLNSSVQAKTAQVSEKKKNNNNNNAPIVLAKSPTWTLYKKNCKTSRLNIKSSRTQTCEYLITAVTAGQTRAK